MRATFRIFNSTFKRWEALFQEAAEFATSIGRENLISISHSEEERRCGHGLVLVALGSTTVLTVTGD